MKISYKEAVKLIQTADVVKIDNDAECVINTHAIAPEMTVLWNDDEFQVCVQNFDNIEQNGHVLTFVDTDGVEFDLYLYNLTPIEHGMTRMSI